MPEKGVPDYSALRFPDPPADRPYVVTNMVMSADGKVTVEGTERGLGSPTDQRLMRELRAAVDMVLNGASTLRKSGTSSRVSNEALVAKRVADDRSPNPVASVLSASGDLPLDKLFFHGEDFEALVYLADSAPDDRREAIEATGRAVVTVPAADPVPAMLRHMREHVGARALLVEGGPTINGSLLAADAIDEYFLTLGPVLVSGDAPLTPVEAKRAPSLDQLAQLELISARHNPETSELYLRYRVAGRGERSW
jgi:2,5-diamino-6-(ribosylamino)-4(3H)-pyrimidinone 5'-phosphate reductase